MESREKRPLIVMTVGACFVHGAAVVLRGISKMPQPTTLELWLTGLGLVLAGVLLARRRNARALAGGLVALAFFSTNLQILLASDFPRGMRANTSTGMIPGDQQMYVWFGYRPGERFLDSVIPDDTLSVLFGVAVGAVVIAALLRKGVRMRRTYTNAEEVPVDHFARPLLFGLTGWLALVGLPGRFEDVFHGWRYELAGLEAAIVANRAGALANLVPFFALLALTLSSLARRRTEVVAAAMCGVLAVLAAAAAAWLDGGLLWSLATALPTTDPGVVVMPAVIEGRPAWAIAIVVGAILSWALVAHARSKQHEVAD